MTEGISLGIVLSIIVLIGEMAYQADSGMRFEKAVRSEVMVSDWTGRPLVYPSAEK